MLFASLACSLSFRSARRSASVRAAATRLGADGTVSATTPADASPLDVAPVAAIAAPAPIRQKTAKLVTTLRKTAPQTVRLHTTPGTGIKVEALIYRRHRSPVTIDADHLQASICARAIIARGFR